MGEGELGALYVHVPFCRSRCAYCDFATAAASAKDPLIGAYVDSVCALLDRVASSGLLRSVRTAYIGGGTPTFVGKDRLCKLVGCITDLCPRVAELTVEANPDSLDVEMLGAVACAGATRVSIGVQSLVDSELRALGRVHTARRAKDALSAAVASGLEVSADVMCATPLQTDVSLARTLVEVLDRGVGHVSVYPLAIEEGTRLARQVADSGGDAPWNDADVAADRMELAASLLVGAGLGRYEVASYARSGSACAHNIAYWSGVPYLGLGTASASMLDDASYDALRGSCAPQLPTRPREARRARLIVTSPTRAVAEGACWQDLHFDIEFLDSRQALSEDLMLAMRMSGGVAPRLCQQAKELMGPDAEAAFRDAMVRGLAIESEGRLVPTDDGWLRGNELYGIMWDLARGHVIETSC